MNPKLSLNDYFTSDKPIATTSSQQGKPKAKDARSKITESLLTHYKQSTNHPKRKKLFDYKISYESQLTRPFHLKAPLIIEDNKFKRDNSQNKTKNCIDSTAIALALSSNTNFISHNKHKSTGLMISNASYFKDKGKKGQQLGVSTGFASGIEVSQKLSKEKEAKDRIDKNQKHKLNAKLSLGIGNNKKSLIKNYLLSNNHISSNGGLNTISHKPNEEQASMTIQKRQDSNAHSHYPKYNAQISRSNSISNLDQTTKTSTEATTTTSKRLCDQILKQSSKKQVKHNPFNNQMNPNLSTFFFTHFAKPSHKKHKVNKRNNHLNNSILNQLKSINKTMTNQHILNTEEAPIQTVKHSIAQSDISNAGAIAKGSKLKLNDTGSLSLLSEDSVFNYSKHRSTSGNNNSNSLAYQNDSISLKRSSNKHSSNTNTIDKRSSSKDKLSFGNEDPTVSFTYSDDEITGRKSRKTRRNAQRAFNNEDFLTFYTEMNQKLFGCNPNLK